MKLRGYIASARLRSTSFKTSLLAPLNKIVQAFGLLHSVKKVKYSSPIFLISNKPHSNEEDNI